MSTPQRRRVTDADSLKALAHPARMALLGALVARGPLTASQAAEIVGESPSNCSWHLRKLAEHGFVREAAGATGRNRPWEAAQDGLEWAEGDDADPATRVAADTLTDALLERELADLRHARHWQEGDTPQWREAMGLAQSQMWLTAEEAQEISTGIRELFTRFAERQRDPAQRPADARLVSMVGWVVPKAEHGGQPDRPPGGRPGAGPGGTVPSAQDEGDRS